MSIWTAVDKHTTEIAFLTNKLAEAEERESVMEKFVSELKRRLDKIEESHESH